MKLNCNKNELYKLVNLAERSTGKNPSLISLASILLRAAKNRLFVISTNLEVAFEGSLAATIEQEGETLSPAKTLMFALYSNPDEEIDITSSGGNLKIISKTSSTNLKCLPIDEFPTIPKIKKENHFSIPHNVLIEALKNTIPATATTYTKPELASVFIFSQGKIPITFVATDSFRLAEQKTDVSYPSLSLLLPQKSCQEIIRIFEDSSDDIEIIFNKNQILFQNRNISFLSRLTEGKFPDYQAIIPKAFETQVFTEKSQILNAVRAAGVFSSRLSEVSISVDADKNALSVKSANADTGEYQANYAAKISGDTVETNFNYHYLLEALQAVDSTKIFLGFNGPQKAVLIRGADDARYLHLVMPMRGV